MKSKISCWRLVRSMVRSPGSRCRTATNVCSHSSALDGWTQAGGSATSDVKGPGLYSPRCACGGIGRRARLRALSGVSRVVVRVHSGALTTVSFGIPRGLVLLRQCDSYGTQDRGAQSRTGRSSCPRDLCISSRVLLHQEEAASTALTTSTRLTEHPRWRSVRSALFMTVRGSLQRHRWEVDVSGQPRLLRRLISAVVAIAQSSKSSNVVARRGSHATPTGSLQHERDSDKCPCRSTEHACTGTRQRGPPSSRPAQARGGVRRDRRRG